MADDTTVDIDGRSIRVSHPDKLLFPESGIAKIDLARYYAAVGDALVRHTSERPLTMVRHPDGIGAGGFFQKAAAKYFPDWIPRVAMQTKDGSTRHAVANEAATLVYLAQQNMITPHVGLARRDDLRRPDRFVVDLDPSVDDLAQVKRMALAVADLLRSIDLEPFVQTTGSKGFHVVVALDREATYEAVGRFAGTIGTVLLGEHPDDLTSEFSKAERGDRIYLDLGRNGYAATMVAPYGVRAYEGAPVATPVTWDELRSDDVTPRSFTIADVPERLGASGDPWADLDENPGSLRRAAKALAAT